MPATLHNFDASVYSGKRTILAMADGYRCSECGGETIDGSTINMLMRRRIDRTAGHIIATLP